MSSYDDFMRAIAKRIECGPLGGGAFRGYSDTEIALVEQTCGCRLPQSFSAFLRIMGHSAGHYGVGRDLLFEDPREYVRLNRTAVRIMSESGYQIPASAFVFTGLQDYAYAFFVLTDGDNPPVWNWSEVPPATPELAADSFTAYVEDDVEFETSCG